MTWILALFAYFGSIKLLDFLTGVSQVLSAWV